MIDLDRQLEESDYWRFTPSGIPIPGFFDAIEWTERQRSQFWKSHRERFAHLSLPEQVPFLFSYEAEHRREPIRTMAAASAALARISTAGYDTGPGLAVKAAREAAREQLYREEMEAAEARRRQSPEFKRDLELARKQLPASPAENLALMRAALRMPAKAREVME